jgi:hypothetical protein
VTCAEFPVNDLEVLPAQVREVRQGARQRARRPSRGGLNNAQVGPRPEPETAQLLGGNAPVVCDDEFTAARITYDAHFTSIRRDRTPRRTITLSARPDTCGHTTTGGTAPISADMRALVDLGARSRSGADRTLCRAE